MLSSPVDLVGHRVEDDRRRREPGERQHLRLRVGRSLVDVGPAGGRAQREVEGRGRMVDRRHRAGSRECAGAAEDRGDAARPTIASEAPRRPVPRSCCPSSRSPPSHSLSSDLIDGEASLRPVERCCRLVRSLYEVTATPARNQTRYPYCVMSATAANAGICAAIATAAGVARPRSRPRTQATMAASEDDERHDAEAQAGEHQLAVDGLEGSVVGLAGREHGPARRDAERAHVSEERHEVRAVLRAAAGLLARSGEHVAEQGNGDGSSRRRAGPRPPRASPASSIGRAGARRARARSRA